jgi:hypothetical protein
MPVRVTTKIMPRRALWFFQRTGPGQIRRISNPSMQRFLVGERALPHDGDGFVRCIGMSLEVQDRKPAQVARVWFSKIRVNDDGKVDPHHHHETAKQAQTEVRQVTPAGSSLVVAGHRFALRRLAHLGEWRPEERDLLALRAVVNTKAGKQML